MKLRVLYILIFYVSFCSRLWSQHYQFSQYYAASTYLNPAFTGANVCSRFAIHYRNQWSGVPNAFTTYMVSLDHAVRRYKSGVGIQFFNDKAGAGALTTSQISLLYAYETKINKKIMGRGGLSVGTVQRRVDYSMLTLGDQILNNSTSSVEGFSDQRTNYFDVGAGMLVYSRYAWLGISGAHINKPNQSLMGNTSPLPREIKLHGGYKFLLEEAEVQGKKRGTDAVIVTFNYKKQNNFNQLDAGLYYSKTQLVFGFWYRGLPLFRPEKTYRNNDALIFLIGLSADKYRIGYSYDWTISKLSNARSHGSHEISIAYQLCNSKKSKKKKANLISCPKF